MSRPRDDYWFHFGQPVWARLKSEIKDETILTDTSVIAWRFDDEERIMYLTHRGSIFPARQFIFRRPEGDKS